MRHRICASGIAVLLVWTSLAGAQARDPAVAEALYKAGREAVTRGDYVTACPKFEQSQQLDPGDGTLFNLANCEEHLSRFVSASRHWREAAEMLPPTDPRRQAAQDKAAAAEARAAKLVIRLVSSSPPGSAVKLDDAEVASAGLGAPLLVDPGRHVLLARAPRYEERPYVIVLSEGELKEVVVAPGPELTPALTTSPPAAAPALISSPAPDVGSRTPAPRPRSFLEQHRWSMIGAGVAAGLAGRGARAGDCDPPSPHVVHRCLPALQRFGRLSEQAERGRSRGACRQRALRGGRRGGGGLDRDVLHGGTGEEGPQRSRRSEGWGNDGARAVLICCRGRTGWARAVPGEVADDAQEGGGLGLRCAGGEDHHRSAHLVVAFEVAMTSCGQDGS
jgi:hypothetical protein